MSVAKKNEKVYGVIPRRRFSDGSASPYAAIPWEKRDARILNASGEAIFEQKDVEVPRSWSQTATNIVASKYFYGKPGAENRETSVKDLVCRVVDTITKAGVDQGYFTDPFTTSAGIFADELAMILLEQRAAFNSPVWFNVGLHKYEPHSMAFSWHWSGSRSGGGIQQEPTGYLNPQCSACFIQSVEDSMEGIMELARNEAMLFKYGSGTGTNFSSLRSSLETVSGGGHASGPLSFMKGLDAFAGVIKSGGKTRRAAKMAILNVDHPDIEAFIDCKLQEEQKAHTLMAAGYDGSGPDSEAYSSIFYQNANNSVRVSDAFMRCIDQLNSELGWDLKAVKDGKPVKQVQAFKLMHKLAQATWACGDPGMQFDDTINLWHTCPESGRINASNPCCFVAETLADTSEGKIRFDLLEQMYREGKELPWAFSHDMAARVPTLRKIKRVWQSGLTWNLVEVLTQRGLRFRCTPEHEFYLHSGEKVCAGQLVPGQRLRKIGRWASEARANRLHLNHRETDESLNGTEIQARWMWEQAFGPIPDGMEVHHKNDDCSDDRLSNFELRAKREHQSNHSAGQNNPRFISVSPDKLVDTWEQIEAVPKKTHKNGDLVTPARWNQFIKENRLVGIVPMAGSPSNGGKIQGMSWEQFAGWVEQQQQSTNDRVLSVTPISLSSPVPVFDMEVEGTHNFGVTCEGAESLHSIIVHNSEYMFLDDSACNLASINLLKYLNEDGSFDIEGFKHTVDIMILAQDILVDLSGYPTEQIARNSHDYRPLGLGYANLGALLMAWGFAYDSELGRALAASITALMTGEAYRMSAEIAGAMRPLQQAHSGLRADPELVKGAGPWNEGAFPGWFKNASAFEVVIKKHVTASLELASSPLRSFAIQAWERALVAGQKHGYRNSQVTVLAPTGTIGFLMDCDTTGIEPCLGLVSYKKLVGGGQMKIVNETVPRALRNLGYDGDVLKAILGYIEEHNTVEGTCYFDDAGLAVFDTSFPAGKSRRSISWQGHLKMMAAVQPFLSGAISKTVNMPEESTVEDIEEAYIEAWKLGLKSVAIYRDGSKKNQVLTVQKVSKAPDAMTNLMFDIGANLKEDDLDAPPRSKRHRLPDERQAVVHKFNIAGHEGYLTVGLYKNGMPGEIFLKMAKEGSTVSGLSDTIALLISIGLQHGVPLTTVIDKLSHTRFEPAGFTPNPEIRYAKSLVDYLARYLDIRFLKPRQQALFDAAKEQEPPPPLEDIDLVAEPVPSVPDTGDAPACQVCGSIMVRNGTCYKCTECGSTSGCS